MTKTIEIVVGPTGEIRVQTKGFAGAACREADRFVEQALGRRMAETFTPDYHRQEQRRRCSSER